MQDLYIGVDPSLTGFAVVILNGTGDVVKQAIWRTEPADFVCFSARIDYLREKLNDFLDQCAGGSAHVAIEGYSFGSSNGRELAGGLGEFIRHLFWRRHIEFLDVPPTTLKGYVCGAGIAKKELILREVFRRWGYVADDNNLADAYALARLALEVDKPGFGNALSRKIIDKLFKVKVQKPRKKKAA